MTKLELFREQVSVGTYVTLRFVRSEDAFGRITEIHDTYVCLDVDGHIVTFVEFENVVSGWEVSHSDPMSSSDGTVDEREADRGRASPLTQHSTDHQLHPRSDWPESMSHGPRRETSPPLPRSNELLTDPNALTALEDTKASFSKAVKEARLEPPTPDFAFPSTDFEKLRSQEFEAVRREWNRAKNKYDNALRINEIHRLKDIVAEILNPLVETYPDSTAAKYLLGCVLLVVASLGETDASVEYNALREYFGLSSPRPTAAWFRFVRLSLDRRCPLDVANVIHDWSDRPGVDVELLSKSLIYLSSSSGLESVALKAAANLVYSKGDLPTGWKEEFDNGVGRSDDFITVERHLLRSRVFHTTQQSDPKSDPEQRDRVPRGHIKSFGARDFGFIDSQAGETFFFRIADVEDSSLQKTLRDGTWKNFGEVAFDVIPSSGHKYERAANVIRNSSEGLLQRAQRLVEANQDTLAMSFVRRALRMCPEDRSAKELEDRIKKQIRNQGIGLPKGDGTYACAKRAQVVDRDLGAAERLFRRAIRENDNRRSAIKDLAWLLHQQKRSKDAITLLEANVKEFRGDRAFDNMLATVYQHEERHDDAIKVLTKMQERAKSSAKQSLLKRIAFSCLKLDRYDDAELKLRAVLKVSPGDETAERWLTDLEDARARGSYVEVSERIIDDLGLLSEEGLELSSLARAAIEHCKYKGVEPTKLQSGTTGQQDIDIVENLAKALGTHRPRDRAAYYLSAAALINRDAGSADPRRIYDYMRRYFASMADASLIDKKPADVVRSYYAESIALVSKNDNLDEAWRSLFRYITTFAPSRAKEIQTRFPKAQARSRVHRSVPIPVDAYTDGLRKALMIIMSEPESEQCLERLFEGLLVIGSQSSFGRAQVGDAIVREPVARKRCSTLLHCDAEELLSAWRSRCRDYGRECQRRLDKCRTLTRHQATAASMEDLGNELRKMFDDTTSEVDRRRVNSLMDISNGALGFCKAADFEEKERSYWDVSEQAGRLVAELTDNPTQFSHDGLLPIADHIRSVIEEAYADVLVMAEPELGLQLMVHEYHRGANGDLRLQIEISNGRGCSPASSVTISLGAEKSEYFTPAALKSEAVPTLRGGDKVIVQMTLRPTLDALEERAFRVDATAAYLNRLGEERSTAVHPWTVRLYPDEDFKQIENLYTPHVHSGPVEDEAMFFGRDDLLDRLEKSVLGDSGKSVVMFGQMRAGKSSILRQLRRRLELDRRVVPIYFSLQEHESRLSEEVVLHQILSGIREKLDDIRLGGADVPSFSPPGIGELGPVPTIVFHSIPRSYVGAHARDGPL